MSHTKEPAALAILNPSGKAIRIWWSGAEVERARRIARDDFNTSPVYLYSEDVLLSLEKQRDDLLKALQSISNITGDAGFNIGGPLEFCPGELPADEATRLLSLAGEYFNDISKEASRAIASVKGDHIEHQLNMVTSAPAIVFYPAGSLGESVESEGGEA